MCAFCTYFALVRLWHLFCAHAQIFSLFFSPYLHVSIIWLEWEQDVQCIGKKDPLPDISTFVFYHAYHNIQLIAQHYHNTCKTHCQQLSELTAWCPYHSSTLLCNCWWVSPSHTMPSLAHFILDFPSVPAAPGPSHLLILISFLIAPARSLWNANVRQTPAIQPVCQGLEVARLVDPWKACL